MQIGTDWHIPHTVIDVGAYLRIEDVRTSTLSNGHLDNARVSSKPHATYVEPHSNHISTRSSRNVERHEDHEHHHRAKHRTQTDIHSKERKHSSSSKHNDQSERPVVNGTGERKNDGHHHSSARDSPKKSMGREARREKRSRSPTKKKHSDHHEKHRKRSKEREKTHQKEDDRKPAHSDDLRDRLNSRHRDSSKRRRDVVVDDKAKSGHRSSKRVRLDPNENISHDVAKEDTPEEAMVVRDNHESTAAQPVEVRCDHVQSQPVDVRCDHVQSVIEPVSETASEMTLAVASDAEEGEIVTPVKRRSKRNRSVSPAPQLPHGLPPPLPPMPPMEPSVPPPPPPEPDPLPELLIINDFASSESPAVTMKTNDIDNASFGSNDSLWSAALTNTTDVTPRCRKELTEQSHKTSNIEHAEKIPSPRNENPNDENSGREKRKHSRKSDDKSRKRRKHSKQKQHNIVYENLYDDLEISFVSHEEVASLNDLIEQDLSGVDLLNENIIEIAEMKQIPSDHPVEVTTESMNPLPLVDVEIETLKPHLVEASPFIPSSSQIAEPYHNDSTLEEIRQPELTQIEELSTSQADEKNMSIGSNEYKMETCDGELTNIIITRKNRKKKKKDK